MRFQFPLTPRVVAALFAFPSMAVSADAVSVSTAQEVYAQGAEVKVVIQNDSGGTIFVPGCHPFEVETFQEESYARVEREACKWEGVAQALPEGTHELTYTSGEALGKGIFRISVVYGTGCREGVRLGRARCEDFATVVTGSYRVGG